MADCSKYVKLNDVIEQRVYSRDLKDYVVPVKKLRQLQSFDEPKENADNRDDMLRVMFNRCYASFVGFGKNPLMCICCCMRSECYKRRDVGKSKEASENG